MGSLSKQEVNALANKLHKELSEKVRLLRLRALHEYIPSPTYLKVESKLKDIEIYKNIESEAHNKRSKLQSEIDETLKDLGLNKYHYEKDVLDSIAELESNIPEIPKIQDLRDDITLEVIDLNFNVEEYIKQKVDEYV